MTTRADTLLCIGLVELSSLYTLCTYGVRYSFLYLLKVEVHPCTAKGKNYRPEDDVFVDDPSQLIGQEFHFKVKIAGARGLPKRFTVS